MEYRRYYRVFQAIGEALNAPLSGIQILERTAAAMVTELGLKSCHFQLLSRDGRLLEQVASAGLSREFLDKGPVEAERSTNEALQGKVVAVADAPSDDRVQYREAFAREGIASMLTVPLATRGQVIGVMRVATAEKHVFSPEEVEFHTVAALLCTSAVTHAMFHSILHRVTDAVRSSLELDEVLSTIVRAVTEELRTRGCSIRLLDARGQRLELRASFGLSDRYLERASAQPGPGVKRALEGEPVAILDATTDPLVSHHDEVVREGIASMLVLPLTVHGQVIGVLSLYTNRRYEFSGDETDLMLAIAEECALAIRNAQMFAAVKRQYETIVGDFHQWFDHHHTGPARPTG